MAIATPDFEFVCNLARQNAALVLETGKEYLVETRLAPLAQREGFGSLPEMIAEAKNKTGTRDLHAKIVDALTTNETSFFRDFHPFETLKRHLIPELLEKRASVRRLCIWSAACSTGQEPYSIAMLLREHFPALSSWKIEIIATDLSATVLARAQAGIFSQLEVNRGLPAMYLVKYFDKVGDCWRIKDHIKSMIQFRPLNLIGPWSILPPLDLVFVRNVMIYFDVETKKTILKKLRATLLPHGTLFLGTAETTLNLDPAWYNRQIGNATVYQLAPVAAAA